MTTNNDGKDGPKPRGVRKATLPKNAVEKLTLRIDFALQDEGRRHLGPSAVNFLRSIKEQLTEKVVRLSKAQRDTTDEILEQACSGEPLVFLEGEAIEDLGKLIRYATGDVRVSALEENIMAGLKGKAKDPIIAIGWKKWRILEEIRQNTRFGLPGEPPPVDIDGIAEDDDLDDPPPEHDTNEADDVHLWVLVGVDEDGDRRAGIP